jgi:hypothetical protein
MLAMLTDSCKNTLDKTTPNAEFMEYIKMVLTAPINFKPVIKRAVDIPILTIPMMAIVGMCTKSILNGI